MELPAFDEFLETLDPDKFADKINQLMPLRMIEFDLRDIPALQNALAMLYQQAAQDAVKISLLYLQAYHEWLQENL